MKKIILSAAFLAIAGLTTVKADSIRYIKPFLLQQDSTTKVPVELENLPDSVKLTLQSEPLKAWTPVDAFFITNPDKTAYYLINVKKEDEVGSLKIDKEGKIIQ